MNYWQITFATGYVSLWTNALRMLQSLVVNTTFGDVQKTSGDPEANTGPGSAQPPSQDTDEAQGLPQSGSDTSSRIKAVEKDAPERVLVVVATKDDEEKDKVELEEASDPAIALPPLGNGTSGPMEDSPKTRALYRKWFGILAALSLVVIILGIAWGNDYNKTERDAAEGMTVRNLRCA